MASSKVTHSVKAGLADTRLFKNLAWSFLGTGLPLLVAVVAIPRLIYGIGLPGFGVLSLAWIVVGYFSLFDLGLGRAMTQLIAQKIGNGQEADIPSVVWTGMGLMTALGVVGAVVMWLLAPWLAGSKLAIPDALRAETHTAFQLLAVSIPVVIATTGLRGILEAYQRFDIVNIVRLPLGVLTYLGPLAVLPYSSSLPAMVVTLVAARVASLAAYFIACLRLHPELARPTPYRPALLRQMLGFGGWMTVSNIVAPFLLYLGRFLLAVLASTEAVAYFSTPYDILANLLIIPGVLVSVYFPSFAQQFGANIGGVRRLYADAMRYNLAIMLPLAVITYALAKPVLVWWIGATFTEHSYRVAQLLAIGVFINSFGHIAQAIVQAYGRPDLTAKLHVIELVCYVPYLWWLIHRQGVDGAAMAWVVRVAISTSVLWLMAKWCLSGRIPNVRPGTRR
jgi:O-antigen/teichoic acid export membrane protein